MLDRQEFRHNVNIVLEQTLGNGMQEFALDGEGVVKIAFPDEVDVTLQAAHESRLVLVSSEICRLGGQDMTLRALSRSYFQMGPPGSFMAYDQETDALVLCNHIGEALFNIHDFGPWLAEFVTTVGLERRAFLSGAVDTSMPADIGTVDAEYVIRL